MSLAAAVRSLQSAKRDIEREVRGAVRRSLAQGLVEARRLSSGPLTPADKVERDRPYATRHGPLGKQSAQPGGNAAIINIVTGQFKQGWRTEGGNPAPGTIASGTLVNRDEKVDWLVEGTKHMIARPVDLEAEARMRHIAEAEVSKAVAKAVRKYE